MAEKANIAGRCIVTERTSFDRNNYSIIYQKLMFQENLRKKGKYESVYSELFYTDFKCLQVQKHFIRLDRSNMQLDKKRNKLLEILPGYPFFVSVFFFFFFFFFLAKKEIHKKR